MYPYLFNFRRMIRSRCHLYRSKLPVCLSNLSSKCVSSCQVAAEITDPSRNKIELLAEYDKLPPVSQRDAEIQIKIPQASLNDLLKKQTQLPDAGRPRQVGNEKDLFNMDETGQYYRATPDYCMRFKNDPKPVGEQELIDLNKDEMVTEMIKSWKTPGPQILEQVPSPRHIKTHLPFPLLPPGLLETCKVFYVARNPKDVAVSYYHHNRHVKLHDYTNDFSTYWNYFKNDLVVFSPYWAHVKDGWKRRDHPNLLFMYYEDMIKDMPSAVRKVADFLGKTLSDDEIHKLAQHLHIDNFRKNVPVLTSSPLQGFINPKEEGFIRRGQIGGNKELNGMTKEADEWIENKLRETGITPFPLH